MSKIFHSLIFRFIIVTLVFFAATSPIIVLFGPFGNLKRAVVGAIMRSRHPQYITWLYNQEELNEILGVVKTTEQTQVLSFKPRTDSTLSLQKIETTRFVGYLLEIPNPQRIQVATAEDIQEKGRPSARHSDTGQRNGPAGNRDCVCQFEAQEEKTGYSEGAGGQQDDPVAHGENGAGTEEAMMPGYISIDRKSFGRYAYNIRKNQKNKVERWRHEDSTD